MREEKSKIEKLGNSMAISGGFCTIIGLTVLQEHPNIQIAVLVIGVVLALYGVTLIKKGKK